MIGTNDLGALQCLGGEKAILEAAPGTAERFVGQKLCIHIWMLQHLHLFSGFQAPVQLVLAAVALQEQHRHR